MNEKDIYREAVSQTVLSAEKKTEIINRLKSAKKNGKKTEVIAVSAVVAKKKRRIKTISAIAAVLVVVIGASWLLSNFIHIYSVSSPISVEEYMHMADVAENAQYLPNENILATGNAVNSLSDAQTTGSTVLSGFYDDAMLLGSDDLAFSLENYRDLNDSLATVSSTSSKQEMSIYDIKKEVQTALEIVPGYDQWFMLPGSLPHLDEEKHSALSYYAFKIGYDKTSGKITVERLCFKRRAESYDKNSGKFYSTGDAYQRQYFKVEYYFDEDQREVVDCTVIDYLCIDDKNYYPISAQRLINVKDSSLTKYAATYMRSPDVVDPSRFGNNDSLYDLTDMYDYGINTIVIQMNYDSSDDISFIKSYYEAPDAHYGRATLGELTYYRKTPDHSAYFTAGWDNRTDDWDESIRVYNNITTNIPSKVRDSIIRSFAYIRDIRYNMLCDECEDNKPSADGIFIDCRHGVLLDHVNRSQIQIFSDSENILGDPQTVLNGITEQYAKAASCLGLETGFTLGEGEHFFETSVNNFCVDLSKEYYYKNVQTTDYAQTDKTVNKSSTQMKEKHVVDAIKDKYDFTYDVDDDSVMKGTDVYYDVELKTNICDPDPDCGYYLAVILQREEADAPYTVLARVPIDARSDENVRISGHLTIDTLVEYSLKQCPAYDSSMHFRLAYAVVKYSASGSSVLVSPSRTIDVDYSDSRDLINTRMYYDHGGIRHSYCVSPYNGGISIRLGY